ncbi:hypothetical protein [Nostoc sp.]|uniref:hypothetical protein n=1 Tax=Nostoc sp. TaxID=1180 RepID=UPI002FFCEB97
MLDKDKLGELVKIATKASEKMLQSGYPDFSLTGIKWDEEEAEWIVSFYSDYGNENSHIGVSATANSYVTTGKYYE